MFFLTLLILLGLLVVLRKKRNAVRTPPMAKGAWPIVGHTFIVIRNVKDLYTLLKDGSMDIINKGGVVVARFAAFKVYGIADPDDANIVLNACLKKDLSYDYCKIWLGDGLITATETIWKKHRKLLNPTFNQFVLDSYLSEVNKQARLLVRDLGCQVGKGKFDHAPLLEHMTLQTICSIAMGVVMDDESKRMREDYIEAKNKFESIIVQRAQRFWLHSEFIYKCTKLCKMQQELASTLRQLTTAVIQKRKLEKSVSDSHGDQAFKPFLDRLLDMSDNGIFTDNEVKEEVDTFITAGSETSSVSLTLTLLIISSYPEVQKKILNELREVFKDQERDVETQDLKKLKYLETVIKEALRLYPVVPIVARAIEKDLKLTNYRIPGGSRCFVSIYGLHRHPAWGPDADRFRPERWLAAEAVPKHAFAPFGLGKRSCIGGNFAMMSMKTVLCHVMRRYRVSGDVTQLEQVMQVTARPVPKNYISIKRRTKAEYGAGAVLS